METVNQKIVKSSFWANLFKTHSGSSEIEEVLSLMPPFKDLSKKHFRPLMKIIHNRTYVPGEYIFFQNDPGICLYIIINGEVAISHTQESEKLELAILNRGDFFGELALIDEARRSASAMAVTETQIAVIFRPDLDEFVETYPREGVKILKGISHIVATRLRNLNQDYFSLYNKNRNK